MSKILFINACRAKSGGAVSHLTGILEKTEFRNYCFSEVHVITYKKMFNKLLPIKNIILHTHPYLNKNIFFQLYWERFLLKKLLIDHNCDILLNVDAGSVSNFSPSVVISQDLLSFIPKEMNRYFFSISWIRLYILKFVQMNSFKKSDGIIFLTEFAQNTICRNNGILKKKSIVINHGLNQIFLQDKANLPSKKNIKILYVSNVTPYKHHVSIVKAAKRLDNSHIKFEFIFIGGGKKNYLKKLKTEIFKSKFKNVSFKLLPFIENKILPKFYKETDYVLFASSCENMPITLLEGMASGKPLISSNRGPMPEILGEKAIYFDPENALSISNSIMKLIKIDNISEYVAPIKKKALTYTWEKCSDLTFNFLLNTLEKNKI